MNFERSNDLHKLYRNNLRHDPSQPTTFHDPETAPLNRRLTVRVKDARGEYTLPFNCMRDAEGRWFSVRTGGVIAVPVVGWKYGERGR